MCQIIKNDIRLSAVNFLLLIKAVGWSDENRLNLDGLQRAIQQCSAHYSVWEGPMLVGISRVLSDDYLFSTIPEIIIHPSYQKNGLGRALMNAIIADFGHTILFFGAQAGSEGFYEKLGFKKGPQSYEGLFHPPTKK